MPRYPPAPAVPLPLTRPATPLAQSGRTPLAVASSDSVREILANPPSLHHHEEEHDQAHDEHDHEHALDDEDAYGERREDLYGEEAEGGEEADQARK